MIRRGDRDITEAIARGMLEGIEVTGNRGQGTGEPGDRGTTSSVSADALPPSPEGEGMGTGEPGDRGERPHPSAPGALPPSPEGEGFEELEQVEIVSAEADRRKVVAQLVRVAVGNDKTAEDYRHMVIRARGLYATPRRSGPLHKVAGALLLAWAMLWDGFRYAYRAQDRVLKPR